MNRPTVARRPDAGFAFGLHVDEANLDGNLHTREQQVGRAADVVLTFAKVGDKVDGKIASLMEAGYEVVLTLEYWGPDRRPDDPAWSLKEIAGGRHDREAAEWFESFADLPRPVHLRPLHEGNGDWYPWGMLAPGNTVADYIPAFRHVADQARRLSNDKVRMQWCVNRVNARDSTDPMTSLWPGSEYVDDLVINGYSRPEHSRARSFTEIFTPHYEQLRAIDATKPMWIGETACTERHGNKPEWILEMFAAVRTTVPVACLTWFDERLVVAGEPDRDWNLDSSPNALTAFAAGLTT